MHSVSSVRFMRAGAPHDGGKTHSQRRDAASADSSQRLASFRHHQHDDSEALNAAWGSEPLRSQ